MNPRRIFRAVVPALLLTGGLAAHSVSAAAGDVLCVGQKATIVGTRGPDVLRGTTGEDVIAGLGGNDVIRARGSDDFICGGAGDDKIVGGPGFAILLGGGGRDTITKGEFIADGGGGADILRDGFFVRGSGGDDRLSASAFMSGDAGNDTLTGDERDNSMEGGAGDDVLDGGEGRDLASFRKGPVDVDLVAGAATGEGTDTLIDVEDAWGSPQNDLISGTPDANVLTGDGGDDTIDGRGGFDFVAFVYLIEDRVSVDLDAGLAFGNEESDELTSIEGIVGSDGDDELFGSAEANMIVGGPGNDDLQGRGADDYLIGFGGARPPGGLGLPPGRYLAQPPPPGDDTLPDDDRLDGGEGSFDLVDFFDPYEEFAAVVASLITGEARGQGTDALVGIEAFSGSDFDDELTGDPQSNYIAGAGGDDSITGGAGDDQLDGGEGSDAIDAGEGSDTCSEEQSLTSCEATASIGVHPLTVWRAIAVDALTKRNNM